MDKKLSVPKLVGLLQNGDQKAYDDLYKLFTPKILNTCKKMYLNQQDAEEVVQEVFLKVWIKRADLDNTLSFNAYLLAIMRSLIFKRSRKQALDIAYQKYNIQFLQKVDNSTEESILYEEIKSFSTKAIASLPKGQQEVFSLKFSEQLTADEIAEKLQISKRTVENQLYKATKKLKKQLISNELIPYELLFMLIIY
ncbi:RNA polymerase sigma factor [Cyclobacterium amurskyense]|uniref:RNA polymerase sigma factor n=1 Tax=Cyclobacterium amurskyense TaxID=320787 RepID=A0A0H4PKB5_9BACT|nr:sigma-70 family RNA polymerase sigma factor [Cyclobacterium amurskyense]AKP53433.1 RNA polymerase sigma factor [Cyclobacterium amurskyense]